MKLELFWRHILNVFFYVADKYERHFLAIVSGSTSPLTG
jgi:hypothetical protein